MAVKVFRLDLIPEDVARLADALRRLVGEAGYLAAGLEGATAYTATDYHAAETLDVLLRHLAPATIEAAVPLLRSMAAVLDQAWAAGPAFGHGALHPRDIFVTPGTGDVSISGLGVARALESIGAKAPIRRPYTAPERASGDAWDIRADVFSLGAIAHELLTGRRPAGPGEQDGALPTATSPEDRVRIRRVLSKALAELPGERFASAADFVDALENPSWAVGAAPATAEVAVAPAIAPVVAAADLGPTIADPPRDISLVPAPVATPVVTPTETPRPALTPLRTPRTPVRVADRPIADASVADAPIYEPMSPPLVAERRDFRAAVQPPIPMPGKFPVAAFVAAIAAAFVLGAAVTHQYLCSSHPGMCEAPAAVALPPAATPPVVAPPAAPVSTDTDVAVTPPTSAPANPSTGTSESSAPKTTATAPAGRLSVKSTPSGASVMIDGRPAGKTPLNLTDLSLATHAVSVSRPGFVTETRRVALTRRAPSAVLVITLKTERAGSGAAALTTGSISVDSRPRGARVTMDGRNLGVTPLSVPGVSPGAHTVRVELAGHKPVTTSVMVKAGETARIALTLEQR